MTEKKSARKYIICSYGRSCVVAYDEADTRKKQDEFGVVYVEVDKCVSIREWGTDKGLNQLTYTGPRDQTILDPCPITIIIPLLSVHDFSVCNPSASEGFHREATKAFAGVTFKT